MNFDTVQNKIVKKFNTPLKDKTIEDFYIDEFMGLKEDVIVTYTLLKDFFSTLKHFEYYKKYSTIMDYTDMVWNGVFFVKGEIRLHERVKLGSSTYLDECDILVIIDDINALCNILDKSGTTIFSVPFVRNGKIVDRYDESLLKEVNSLRGEYLYALSEASLKYIDKTILSYKRKLSEVNKQFDLYMTVLLSRYEGMVDNGIDLAYIPRFF